MKILNLGCGNNKIPNAVNVDIDKKFNPDVVFDLNKKWNFAKNNEFDLVIANHIIEYLDNLYFIMSEIHRVSKNGGIVKIRVPHFSCVQAYSTIGHKQIFTCDIFKQLLNFKLKKIRLNYTVTNVKRTSLKKILSFIPELLANLNIWFCERVWCYLVGGFSEIYVELVVIK